MKFRTEIKIDGAPKKLSPERLVLLAGSCFSDNIGDRMVESGWPVIVNPCGVIYNPVSMAVLFQLALLQRALRRSIVADSITLREGNYVSWFMGSLAMAQTAEECVDKACEAIDRLEEGLEKADAIILTFGTSDVWLLKGTDRAVGNCHKHPAMEFERRRVGIDEITAAWKMIMEATCERRREGVPPQFILTVSPRRYLSDGFAENTRQKAILALSCEKLCKEREDVIYFPAYEILNDDLRDYRFYAKDLLHPSVMAIDYIWEKFTETFLDLDGLARLKEMEKVARRKAHRNISSE